MALDIKTLGELIQAGQGLVSDIRNDVVTIEQAATAVEQARQQLAHSAQIGADGRLVVAYADKAAQNAILAKIVELQMALAGDLDPPLEAGLRAQLADQFFNLANSTNSTVASIVTFSPAERLQISGLIQTAALDAQQRKFKAALLTAAVSLFQAGLRIASIAAA